MLLPLDLHETICVIGLPSAYEMRHKNSVSAVGQFISLFILKWKKKTG